MKAKTLFGKPYLDMLGIEEGKRIELIVKMLRTNVPGRKIAVLVDEEGPDGFEKADRYIMKIREQVPAVTAERVKGPTPHCVTVSVSL